MPDTKAEFYEVLPTFTSAEQPDEWLVASFTSNNGIRIEIGNREDPNDQESENILCCFDFNTDQAEAVGQALVRWAQRSRAETELIRCGIMEIPNKVKDKEPNWLKLAFNAKGDRT